MKITFPLLAVLAALLLVSSTHLGAAEPRPNILVIYTDDQEFSDASCLANDPREMTNSAANPKHVAMLEKMRTSDDTQLADLASQVVRDHGYEHDLTLFSRTLPWEQKARLGDGEASDKPKKKRKEMK